MVKYLFSFLLIVSFSVSAQSNKSLEINGMFVRPSEANSGLGYSLKYLQEYSENITFSASFSRWGWDEMKNFRGYDGDGIITEFYNDNRFYPLLLGIERKLHGDADFKSFLSFELGAGYIDYESRYRTEYYYQDSWGVGDVKTPEKRNQWLVVAGAGIGFSHRAWEIVDLKIHTKFYKIGGDYEKFGDFGSVYLLTHFGFSVLI